MGAFEQFSDFTAVDHQSLAAQQTWMKELHSEPIRKVEVEELPQLQFELTAQEFGAVAAKMNDGVRQRYYVPNQNFHASVDGSKRGGASAWDIGEVLEATLALDGLTDESKRKEEHNQNLNVLSHFWDERSRPQAYTSMYGPSGDKYFDDNSWIGIAFVDSFRQFENPNDLSRARQVFEYQVFGSKGTERLVNPGGVFWTQQKDNLYRATVSTAGAAQLGLELYEETKDLRYLDFARKQYDWVNQYLRDPADGLYYDGLDKNGTIHYEKYTYNQGLMLGDATMLYKVTGDEQYLRDAQNIAKATLEHYKDTLATHMLFFNAVFFKNLMMLDAVAPDPAYRKSLADYANTLIPKINPETGLIKVDGSMNLLDQTSAIQVMALASKYPA